MRTSWLAAALLLAAPTTALAGVPISPEMQDLCERVAADANCPPAADGKTECTCTLENAATGETPFLGEFLAMRIKQKEEPGQPFVDMTILAIKSDGKFRSYGPLFTAGKEMVPNAESLSEGQVDKLWCMYSVPNFGPVCVAEATETHRGTSQELNYYLKTVKTRVFIAYAKDSTLVVLSLDKAVEEELSKLNKGGPVPEGYGKIGKFSWKRVVEPMEDGRLKVTLPKGNHAKVKAKFPLNGRIPFDTLPAFDDEITAHPGE